MLRFLSSLFTTTAGRAEGPDDALIDKAIERVVAGTDQRLRALAQYRKRLWEPVERAVVHVIALVEALPPPVAIGPREFGEDPRLRALFVSTDHMAEVFGKFRTVRDYLAALKGGPAPDEIFGLLTMAKEERNVFGMELEGDMLRRDVMQVAVNFSNHRYLAPTGNEFDTRRELKIRAFDFLIERALERLMDERSQRREMDRQRHLLKQKLDAMRAGSWGLGAMLGDADGQPADLATLEAEIEKIDAEFGQCRTNNLGLEESLACIVDIFDSPADWLDAREVSLRLDARGIKVPDSAPTAAKEIAFMELFSGTGATRIVLFGRIARADLREAHDFWEGAKRYL